MRHSYALAALVGVAVGGQALARSGYLLGEGLEPVVVNGTLFRVTPQVGEPDFNGACTVDHLHVTVNTAGNYAFNALSWEVEFDGRGGGFAVDVNGDGEIAFVDTYLRIFRDDGDLSADDQVAKNDDDFNTPMASEDGTIYGYDSLLRTYLEAGNYVLAVGAYHMSVADAVDGFDADNNRYPVSWDDKLGDYVPSDHGDYRITMGLIPSPGGAALLGVAGLVAIRRRR